MSNQWKPIDVWNNKEPNPMDKYFKRRKDCKHDKGLTYGHCQPVYYGGPIEFDIVCDWCLKPLYRTGGFLDVEEDPRLKSFASIPDGEHKYAALANLHVKIEQKLYEKIKEGNE